MSAETTCPVAGAHEWDYDEHLGRWACYRCGVIDTDRPAPEPEPVAPEPCAHEYVMHVGRSWQCHKCGYVRQTRPQRLELSPGARLAQLEDFRKSVLVIGGVIALVVALALWLRFQPTDDCYVEGVDPDVTCGEPNPPGPAGW